MEIDLTLTFITRGKMRKTEKPHIITDMLHHYNQELYPLEFLVTHFQH